MRNISKFSPKNILRSPLWGFTRLKSKYPLVPPLRFYLTQVKISFGPPFKVLLDSSQNILWSPLWGFTRLKSKYPLIPPLRFFSTQVKISFGPPFEVFLDSSQNILWYPLWGFLLNFLKNRGGGVSFYLGPPFEIFSRGGYTLLAPPLAKHPRAGCLQFFFKKIYRENWNALAFWTWETDLNLFLYKM